MTDLSQTIIPKSDQMNADDLIGGTITIKVTKVSLLAGEQPVSIGYEGDNGKPYKPCKSMRRVLVIIWGSNGNNYVGRSLTLYRDDKVTFGALAVGGIRISHMSHIDKPITLALTASKANRKPFTVKPLITQDDDIERIKELGRAEADKGSEALKVWWGGLGGARHKQLGVEYLNEIKEIAAQSDSSAVDSLDDEEIPLADLVNNMVMRLSMDNEAKGTDDYENVAGSDEFKELWGKVKASGDKGLLAKISEAMNPIKA